MKSLKFLDNLYAIFGEFELWKYKDVNWKSWVKYSVASEDQKKDANLRSLTKPEVVIDMDNPSEFEQAISILDKYNFKFDVWSTCHAGHYHIRIIFPELIAWNDSQIKELRKFFCKSTGGDSSKGSARTMIAIEYKPHFKDSSKIKNKIEHLSKPGINLLNSIFPVFLDWLKYEQPTKTNTHCVGVGKIEGHPTQETLNKIKTRPEIYNLLHSNVPIGFRSSKDFVLAKACVELGISFEEFYRVLKLTSWSKAHEPKHNLHYAERTYSVALKAEKTYIMTGVRNNEKIRRDRQN